MLKLAMIATDVLIRIIADFLVIPIVLVGAWAVWFLPKGASRYQRVARAFMTGLTSLVLAKIISLFYQGERPFVVLGEAPRAAYLNNPGFPSDHALLVFTVAFVVWASTKHSTIGTLLIVMATIVAIGRVIALVHTPYDVIGGFVCAAVATLCWYGRSVFRHQSLSE